MDFSLKPPIGRTLPLKVTSPVMAKVLDTGLGMNDEELESLKTRVLNEDTTSFGLTSAYKRLKLLYGEECKFDIKSVPQEGTSISIEMPGKADIDNETIL